MRTIPEVAEGIKSILNNIERTENCDGETLVDINELVDEILTISTYKGKKQTNADHIRSMSDGELAEFLPIVSDFMCKPTDKCMENIFNRGECEKTKECALKWLQSEVEE